MNVFQCIIPYDDLHYTQSVESNKKTKKKKKGQSCNGTKLRRRDNKQKTVAEEIETSTKRLNNKEMDGKATKKKNKTKSTLRDAANVKAPAMAYDVRNSVLEIFNI